MNILNFILDMDGTIYLGEKLIPQSPDFLREVRERGGKYVFLTNNSSRDARYYAEKLSRMGIEAREEEILTSGQGAIDYLRKQGWDRVFPLATPSYEEELKRAGITLTGKNPQAVLLAFDTSLTYAKLEKACYLIADGVPFIATHPDLVCPTEEGFIPDCGAMQALIQSATGVEPIVLGKPTEAMARIALDRLGTNVEETAMVGDRLYTDVEMGKRVGMTSILVLSGETKRLDLEASEVQPDLVVDSLYHLVDKILPPK